MQTDQNNFRNVKLIKGIDRGALWIRNNYNLMTLVDEDQHVIVEYDPRFFVADNLYVPSAHRPARGAKV